MNLKMFNEAIKCYNQALLIDPTFTNCSENKAKAFNCKGLINIDENNFTEAIECFNKALEIIPTQANYLMNKGILII